MDITTLTINGISCCIRFVQTHNCLPLSSGDAVIQALVCDQNTAMFAPQQCTRIIVPNGESSKTSLILHDLVSSFAALSLTRDSMIVGFGGGAVTDLCAFAAHIYLRGIGVVLVPTSLLAMVDAAVGGKTGIDFAGYKNIVGSFYPAKEIRINPEFTYSLSDREYKSGLAEVIKAALLRDAGLLSLLEKKRDSVMKRELQTVKDCIRAAVLVKAAIVMEDPQEKGIRAYLNLGHTFGHALEACMGLGVWTHGEAVAWGIARAMQAGIYAGITTHTWAVRVLRILRSYGYDVDAQPVSAELLLKAMCMDKKRKKSGLRFVLQKSAQNTTVEALDRKLIIKTVDRKLTI